MVEGGLRMTGELQADRLTPLVQIYTSSSVPQPLCFRKRCLAARYVAFSSSCSHRGLTKCFRLAGRVRIAWPTSNARLASSTHRLTLSDIVPHSKLKPLKAPKKGKAEEDEDDAAVSFVALFAAPLFSLTPLSRPRSSRYARRLQTVFCDSRLANR